MDSIRFGELLGRAVKITPHDVEEILQEQKGTRRRFGEIALAWGLCEPQHVWQAWSDQLLVHGRQFDLDALGIDAQAASLLPMESASRLSAIPVRRIDDTVIVATAEVPTDVAAAEIRLLTGLAVKFVTCDPHQIRRAISRYYTAGPAAA